MISLLIPFLIQALVILQLSHSETPSPTTAPVVACFDVEPGYCPDAGGAGGCFGFGSSETCAKCNYPNQPTLNPNVLGVCKNISKTCQAKHPSDCACIHGISKTSTPFKTKRRFEVYNECSYPIWVGMIGKSWTTGNFESSQIPHDGGFKLESKQMETLSVPIMQSIVLWPRTNCGNTSNGFECDTGSCSNADNFLGRNGTCCATKNSIYNCGGPQSPASKIEFTLANGYCGGNDYYDASLVDGYTIPILVQPINYTLNETIGAKTLGKYGCGTATINRFEPKTYCPDILKFNGTSNREEISDVDFSEFVYCLSVCGAVTVENHRKNFPLLEKWNAANASFILKELYSDSQLSTRFISGQNFSDLLCCRCGTNPESQNGCYNSSECNFGCSPYIEGGWNGTKPKAWPGNKEDYYKRECTNNGYTIKGSMIDETMPMWPLLKDGYDVEINPAYIYKNTSQDAYSWQYNDQSSTFQCRNADYKIVFCQDEADDTIIDVITPSGSTTMPPLTTMGTTTTTIDNESGECIKVWIWSFMVVMIVILVEN